jgi:glycosyltransferase involved in cell wall biosynthesis
MKEIDSIINLSIIVPVYNVEKYLCECIKSIINQTYTNWELILVDDGSTDNSGSICDEFADIDSRIIVLHKPNGGVSSARNLGLEKAQGEWITFIDADDFISPTFLEGLYLPIKCGEQLDFVHGGCINWENGGKEVINQHYDDFIGSDPGYIFEKFRGLAVSKLFKQENIKHWKDTVELRFDVKMKIAEDMAFTIDYLSTVKKYAFVSEIGYYYRKDNISSATRSNKRLSYAIQMHGFEHLYYSTISYINKNKLSKQQSHLRLCQRSAQLRDVVVALYSTPTERDYRLMYLKGIMDSDYGALLAYSKMTIRNLPLIFLRLRFYNIFDMIMTALITNKQNI